MLLLKSPKEKSLKVKILIRTGLCLFFQNPVGSSLSVENCPVYTEDVLSSGLCPTSYLTDKEKDGDAGL